MSEYQGNLFEWYVPYGTFSGDSCDGEGLGEEDIFQPWPDCYQILMLLLNNTHVHHLTSNIDIDSIVSHLYHVLIAIDTVHVVVAIKSILDDKC